MTEQELCRLFEEEIKRKTEDNLIDLRQKATDLLIDTNKAGATRGAMTAIYLIDQEFERREQS